MTHQLLVYKIIEVLKQEADHNETVNPSEFLDKIMGLSSVMDLPDVKEKIIGGQ